MSLVGDSAHYYTFKLGVELDLGEDLILSLKQQAMHMGHPFKFLSLV